MAQVRCPSCNSPLTQEESRSAANCPVCGKSLSDSAGSTGSGSAATAPGTSNAPSTSVRSASQKHWVVVAVVLLLVVGIAGMYAGGFLSPKQNPDEQAVANSDQNKNEENKNNDAGKSSPEKPADKSSDDSETNVPAASDKPADQPDEPGVQPVDPPAQPTVPPSEPTDEPTESIKLPAQPTDQPVNQPTGPFNESVEPTEPQTGPTDLATDKPKNTPEEEPAGIAIDAPDGEYNAESLNEGDFVRLHGKVKTLKLSSVNGRSALDASGLEAKEIQVESINAEATVVLNAPGGLVEIKSGINGQARVFINAAGGKVVFLNGCPITGNCEVTISAREVDFGAVLGSNKVKVVFSKGGKLRFTKMTGSSYIHYKRADPKDPPPTIEAGTLVESSECKEVDW
ncbi:MAG: hypothetical protein O3A00_17135 [Planctomycetota bacterium]|nr:hypothetical protein [Planctomycetota bacterium]